jgi:hypothetical protein
MITIQISSSQREFANAREVDEQWINEQINRRRSDAIEVCVRVTIREDPVAITLNSFGCSGKAGGIPNFNSDEQHVIELWKKHRLDQRDFHGGNLIAFLKQLPRKN